MTRLRASEAHVPLPYVPEYYAQRASVPGTLLITEATLISAQAGGMPNLPGIFNEEQVEAWRKVTDAVHQKGSFIFCQIWAMGRAAYPQILAKYGFSLVSSSPIPVKPDGPIPRELSGAEIKGYVEHFVQAAQNAIRAGFDGVEVHSANGYFLDQFTQDVVNRRTDKYGGSIENRSRLPLEVAKAVSKAIGPDRTGFRISPWSDTQGMRMKDPIPQFTHLIQGLRDLKLAYLHCIESRVSGNMDCPENGSLDFVSEAWKNSYGGVLLVNGGYGPETAKAAVNEKYRDLDTAIVFGRHFLANPDLPFRIRHGLELNQYRREFFYVPGAKEGYIDYPFSAKFGTTNYKV